MRRLIKLAGVTFDKRKIIRNNERYRKNSLPTRTTVATTTPLVQFVFDSYFPKKIEKKEGTSRKKSCGKCYSCQQPACGRCIKCKIGKQNSCFMRLCPNKAVQATEESDGVGEEEAEEGAAADNGPVPPLVLYPSFTIINEDVEWISEILLSYRDRKFYSGAKVGKQNLSFSHYSNTKVVGLRT